MRPFRAFRCKFNNSFLIPSVGFLIVLGILPSAAARRESAVRQENGARSSSSDSVAQDPQAQEPQAPASNYDKAIFQKLIPGDQLAFLKPFAGSKSKDLIRDKQYRKLMHSLIPDCMFHYGWDFPLSDSLDKVLSGSALPVQIRDNRYLMVTGRNGPYLQGKALMWVDLQDGIALGGFYFHPTNGEPTPTVTIFSRQVKEESLKMSQLPPAFVQDLKHWAAESSVAPVTTRYFITGSNKKILLEHDEDYCAAGNGEVAPPDCEQLNADAADMDLDAAYYLEQTNHATNATAWMIVGPDQVAWIQIRNNTCSVAPNRLRCRIRVTRERTHVIVNRHSVEQLPRK